jgi:tellurite resistance protein TerC
MARFRYLQTALAVVLVYVGIKISLVPLGIHIDTVLSLIFTVGTLAIGILYSLWKTRNDPPLEVQDKPVEPQDLRSTDAPNP